MNTNGSNKPSSQHCRLIGKIALLLSVFVVIVITTVFITMVVLNKANDNTDGNVDFFLFDTITSIPPP